MRMPGIGYRAVNNGMTKQWLNHLPDILQKSLGEDAWSTPAGMNAS